MDKGKPKRGAVAARKIVALINQRIESYKGHSMYPAFGLNSRVEECEEIAAEISAEYGLPIKASEA